MILNTLSIITYAQSTNMVPNNIRADNTLSRLAELSTSGSASGLTNNALIGIPVPAGEAVGEVYVNSNWKKTNFLLFKSEKLNEGYLCKYNLLSHQLEINSNEKITAVDWDKIRSYVWMDDSGNPVFYVNVAAYTLNGDKLKGFMTVLVDGKISLVKIPTLISRKPDYKHEFNMGSRDIKFSVRENYYYIKGTELHELKNINAKKLKEIFGEDSNALIEFAEKNSHKGKNEFSYIQIFDFYNNQLAKKSPEQ